MGLISPDVVFDTNNSNNLKYYRLDFKLTAYSIVNNTLKDFSGLDTSDVGLMRNGIGFGITNINIETNASLQPVVEITFKDLYGNSMFLREKNAQIDYSCLFDWPPPKFELSYKGYLGKTVKMLLNLKRTDISYNSSDGSFTIKASFVPNMWGPFADVPVMFLYAVKAMRLKDATDSPVQDFFSLLKVGEKLKVQNKKISDNFQTVQQQLSSLSSDNIFSSGIKYGTINGNSATGKAINSFQIIKVADPKTLDISDDDQKNSQKGIEWSQWVLLNSDFGNNVKSCLTSNEFTTAMKNNSLSDKDTFNAAYNAFKNNNPSDNTNNPSSLYVLYQQTILPDLNKRKSIIQANSDLVDKAITSEGVVDNQDLVNKVTISQIFASLAGDTGYLVGKILKAGLEGYEGTKSNRDGNTHLIGKFFPLKYASGNDNERANFVGAQFPVDENDLSTFSTSNNLTNEWVLVQEFVDGISKGIAEFPASTPGTAGNPYTQDFSFKNRVNNLEIIKDNPYAGVSDSRSIVSNLIIRSGIWAFFTDSNNPNTPYRYYKSSEGKSGQADVAAQNEVANITDDILGDLSPDELNQLKAACDFFTQITDGSGKNFTPDQTLEISVANGNKQTTSYSNIVSIPSLVSSGIPAGTGATESLNHNGLNWLRPTDANSTYVMLAFQNSANQDTLNNQLTTSKNTSSYDKKWALSDQDKLSGRKWNPFSSSFDDGNEPPGLIYTPYPASDKAPGNGVKDIYNNYATSNSIALYNGEGYTLNNQSAVENNNIVYTVFTYTDNDSLSGSVCWDLFGDSYDDFGNALYGYSQPENQRIFLYNAFLQLQTRIKTNQSNSQQTTEKVQSRAQRIKNDIYTQFHHIFYQWYSLVYDDFSIAHQTYATADLPKKIQNIYNAITTQKGCGAEGGFANSFQYIAPLVKIPPTTLNPEGNVDVENSIINLDPCHDINANTTVLNIISNVCTKNNFLFFPIAGANPYDLSEVFEVETAPNISANYGNRFVVMWAPTPESRIKDNKGDFFSAIQTKEDFQNSNLCAFEVKIGSVDNALFKNLQVSTDSTKTTAESIANLQKLVDPKVQEQFQTKDCSTIPVIEGRSYTSEIETLGNAQISPMQYYYLDKMPIFGGLYQIMGVKHNITPNNMVTSFKGMKQRYNKGKYSGIPPITTGIMTDLGKALGITSSQNLTPNEQGPVSPLTDGGWGINPMGQPYQAQTLAKLNAQQQAAINLLNPSAIPVFTHFVYDITQAGYNVQITSSYRTPAKQLQVAQGNSAAATGAYYSMHEYGLACYSDDTELLTENGWKLFKDLNESEKVLVFKNDDLYYEKPNKLISYDYSGSMVSVKTKSIDLLVTPNHKMVTKKITNKKWSNDWGFIQASGLTYQYKIPTAGIYKEENFEMNVPNNFTDSETWWEFMGWYLSEGSCCGVSDGKIREHNSRWKISISQNKNTKEWNLIKNCLDRMNLNYGYYGHEFIIHSKELHNILFGLGNSYQKRIPRYLLKADKKHLSILLESLLLGDGTHYEKRFTYWTVNSKLADDVSELMFLLGHSVSISNKEPKEHLMPHGNLLKTFNTQYAVNSRNRNTQELRNGSDYKKNIKDEKYNGKVYCVSTQAGSIVVKRNGKISICGNCDIVVTGKGVNLDQTSSKSAWQPIVQIASNYNLTWGGNFGDPNDSSTKGTYDPVHFDMRYYFGNGVNIFSELGSDPSKVNNRQQLALLGGVQLPNLTA